jgi:cytochrome bd-type quinol oxidase subunit 2
MILMIEKIKKYVVITLAALALLTPVIATATADAQIQSGLCAGTNLTTDSPGGCENDGRAESKVQGLIKLVINIFSIVVGVVAVVMIIIGGLKYITSSGDSNNVTSAKNTILYAIIGLVIVALAQFLVQFVLAKALTAETLE